MVRIETDEQHREALEEADALMDAEPGSEAEQRLIELAEAIEEYEDANCPMTYPSCELANVIHHVAYGSNWLERVWCRRVRPILCPRWDAMVMAASDRMSQIIIHEYIDAFGAPELRAVVHIEHDT